MLQQRSTHFPVPVSVTVCEVVGMLSTTRSAAREPLAVGLN